MRTCNTPARHQRISPMRYMASAQHGRRTPTVRSPSASSSSMAMPTGTSAARTLCRRTQISAYYTTGLQTNLQGIQSQLNLTTVNSAGQTVNSVTGAPVAIGTNGVGVQAGLFRVKAFTLNVTTTLDRDQFAAWLQLSNNTTEATVPASELQFNITSPPVGSTTQAKTLYASWTHQIRDDLTLGSVASFNTSRVSNGVGNQHSIAASIGMQYLISQTLAATASYSFYDLISSTSTQSYYQNLVLVGLTKQF